MHNIFTKFFKGILSLGIVFMLIATTSFAAPYYDPILGKTRSDYGVGGGGGGGAPTDATYITQTANGTLTNEQSLSSLSTGILKNTNGTGVLSIATAGVDYLTGFITGMFTSLTADSSPTGDDIVATVNDPLGTPANRKVTAGDFITKAHGLGDGVMKVASGIMAIASAGVDYITPSGIETLTNKIFSNTDRIEMDTTPSVIANSEGVMVWNPTDKTLDIYDGTTKLQAGQELHVVAKNLTGSTILNGKVVYITGANTTRPTIALAKADAQATSESVLGVATQDIANNAEGKVTIAGLVNNIDTSAFTAGSAVYLSESTAGGLTTTQPLSPNWVADIGHVVQSNATTGSIYVNVNVITQTANSVRITSGVGVTEMNNVQDFFRHSWSSGVTEGANITDNTDGTVSISSGEVLVRTTSADDAVLMPLVLPAQNNIAITASDVSYLYVDYNAGSPQWVVTTNLSDFDGLTKVIGYQIARNGTSLNILDLRKINIDFGRKQRRANVEWDGFAFKGFFRSTIGVSAFSSSGLNVLVGAGKYFYFNNPFTHSAFDTTVAGSAVANNFIRFYNRSSWQQTTGLKAVNNTQYDNAGTLTAFGAGGNHFRTDWWFVVMGDSAPYLAQIMGNVDYTTLAGAQADPFPTLPPFFDGNAVLIGQSVVQKSVSSLTIQKAGSATFSGSSASSDHSALTNLSWTASGHTGTLSTLAGFDASNVASVYSLSGTGTVIPTTTSPTFTTPALGTPSALVGTNITGTATGLTAGITNALKSATTTIDVSSATAPTSGQVLTATSSTTATWQTPSAGSSTPSMYWCTNFEASARFNPTVLNGTNNFDTSGLRQDTSATATSYASELLTHDTSFNMFAGSPEFSVNLGFRVKGTDASSYYGLGAITVSGTGHTYTVKHIGFKIVTVGSTTNVYATQANGTTETASSSLTTLNANDQIELILKVNGTSSVDYYYRKNGGALSSATNLTTNIPAQSAGSDTSIQYSVSNNSTASNTRIQVVSSCYKR